MQRVQVKCNSCSFNLKSSCMRCQNMSEPIHSLGLQIRPAILQFLLIIRIVPSALRKYHQPNLLGKTNLHSIEIRKIKQVQKQCKTINRQLHTKVTKLWSGQRIIITELNVRGNPISHSHHWYYSNLKKKYIEFNVDRIWQTMVYRGWSLCAQLPCLQEWMDPRLEKESNELVGCAIALTLWAQ